MRPVRVLAGRLDDRRPLQERILGQRGECLAVAADQQGLDVVAVVRVEGHVRPATVAALGACRVHEVQDDRGRDHDARERNRERAAGVGL